MVEEVQATSLQQAVLFWLENSSALPCWVCTYNKPQHTCFRCSLKITLPPSPSTLIAVCNVRVTWIQIHQQWCLRHFFLELVEGHSTFLVPLEMQFLASESMQRDGNDGKIPYKLIECSEAKEAGHLSFILRFGHSCTALTFSRLVFTQSSLYMT